MKEKSGSILRLRPALRVFKTQRWQLVQFRNAFSNTTGFSNGFGNCILSNINLFLAPFGFAVNAKHALCSLGMDLAQTMSPVSCHLQPWIQFYFRDMDPATPGIKEYPVLVQLILSLKTPTDPGFSSGARHDFQVKTCAVCTNPDSGQGPPDLEV